MARSAHSGVIPQVIRAPGSEMDSPLPIDRLPAGWSFRDAGRLPRRRIVLHAHLRRGVRATITQQTAAQLARGLCWCSWTRRPSPRSGSGRGATGQPNATGDGEGALTLVFWGMVVLTGIAAGLLGDELMLLLHGVQHLVFGYQSGSFVAGVAHDSGLRRVVSLAVAGLIGGVA